MSEKLPTKPVNKLKVYGLAILLYLLINGLVFETMIALLESRSDTTLYPMFPFTRIGFLIVTILTAQYYIARKTHKKPRLAHRIAKYVLLVAVFVGLYIGGMLSVINHEEPREPFVMPELPRPTKLEITNPYSEVQQ